VGQAFQPVQTAWKGRPTAKTDFNTMWDRLSSLSFPACPFQPVLSGLSRRLGKAIQQPKQISTQCGTDFPACPFRPIQTAWKGRPTAKTNFNTMWDRLSSLSFPACPDGLERPSNGQNRFQHSVGQTFQPVQTAWKGHPTAKTDFNTMWDRLSSLSFPACPDGLERPSNGQNRFQHSVGQAYQLVLSGPSRRLGKAIQRPKQISTQCGTGFPACPFQPVQTAWKGHPTAKTNFNTVWDRLSNLSPPACPDGLERPSNSQNKFQHSVGQAFQLVPSSLSVIFSPRLVAHVC
jgi:Fe-S-cluster-containing hydrogenase component 2